MARSKVSSHTDKARTPFTIAARKAKGQSIPSSGSTIAERTRPSPFQNSLARASAGRRDTAKQANTHASTKRAVKTHCACCDGALWPAQPTLTSSDGSAPAFGDLGVSIVQANALPTPPASQASVGKAASRSPAPSASSAEAMREEPAAQESHDTVLYAVHHGIAGPWEEWHGTHVKGVFFTMRDANVAAGQIYKEICAEWTSFTIISEGFWPSGAPPPEVKLWTAKKWHNLQGGLQFAFHDRDFGVQYLSVVKHQVKRHGKQAGKREGAGSTMTVTKVEKATKRKRGA